MEFEPQEASMNDVNITPLDKCVTNEDSKVIIAQKGYMDVPLVSTQMTHLQGHIYKSLELGKPLSPLISLEHIAFVIKPPFVDSHRPLMVDYSLTKPS